MRNIAATHDDPSPSLSMTGGNWLLLGLLALLWGSGFFFTTIAVESIGPSTVVLIRVILAAGILYAVIRLRGSCVPAGWASWRPFFVLGLFNTTLPFTLNAWSLARIDSGLAGILTATVPIYTVVVAHFATVDEHFTVSKLVGIGLGMVGVLLILDQDLGSLFSGSRLANRHAQSTTAAADCTEAISHARAGCVVCLCAAISDSDDIRARLPIEDSMSNPGTPTGAPAISLTMNARDWFWLIGLAIIWGASYFFGKVAVEDIGPLTVAFGRVILAAAILYVVIRLRQIPIPRTRDDWIPFFAMGVLNSALPYSLIFWGVTSISSGLAAILTATVPLFTVIVAHFWTVDEKMSPAKAVGIGLGMAGVVVTMGRDLGALTSGSGPAKLAIVAASISYAFSGIYGRRLRGKSPLILAWGQMCAATVLMLPLVLFVDRPWATSAWEVDAVLSVIALATLCTAIAYMIFFRLLGTIGATNTSLVTFMIPASSILLGVAFLSEPLVAAQLLGMGLIIAGMAVIDGRLTRRLSGAAKTTQNSGILGKPVLERPHD